MLTEYEMRRISSLIVEGLVQNDQFIAKVVKVMPKRKRSLRVREVAELLGVSVWSVREMAAALGGTRKGDEKRGQWVFEEDGLMERYQEYCRKN